jgi:hypothetical protein
MPRLVRSARGQVVDFDLIAIANQLASAPPPVSVNERRLFIDEKDGVKPEKKLAEAVPSQVVHEALKLATEGLQSQRQVVEEPAPAVDTSLLRPTYNQDADPE